MALIKDQNSYVDLVEADEYLSGRISTEEWESASVTQKEKALITATRYLDTLHWTGQAVDPSQALSFPRTSTYVDKRLGVVRPCDPTPEVVRLSCIELALHYLKNEDAVDPSSSIRSLSVGPISLQNITEVQKTPSAVTRQLKPLLVKGSNTLTWWRAN